MTVSDSTTLVIPLTGTMPCLSTELRVITMRIIKEEGVHKSIVEEEQEEEEGLHSMHSINYVNSLTGNCEAKNSPEIVSIE